MQSGSEGGADANAVSEATSEPRAEERDERSLADLVTRVSENASLLVREEIELAKAEIEQKVRKIARGAVAGAVAAVFLLFALIYLLQAAAWGINSAAGWTGIWPGFLIVGGALVLLAILGGLIALWSFKSGTPPTPEQAIEEARLIREALEHPEVEAALARPEDGKATE
jgi:uncharacterized membrane protein YqjE